MKQMLFMLSLLFFLSSASAQSLNDFKNAVDDSSKGVQSIHKYPENLRSGTCHFVEITSIEISGSDIKIIETWTDLLGGQAKTVLTGTISGGEASGNWRSSYSNGQWKYNFNTNKGKWNKLQGYGGTFSWEYLNFELRTSSQVSDGFYKCD